MVLSRKGILFQNTLIYVNKGHNKSQNMYITKTFPKLHVIFYLAVNMLNFQLQVNEVNNSPTL